MSNNDEEKNTLFNKIKSFFNALLKRNKSTEELIPEKSTLTHEEERFQSLKRETYINELAEKLLYGEIGPTDVEEEYLDELMDYFKNDIQDTKNKIEQCKVHIQKMQAEMN